ncbi:MAG TPA: uracil-DNA glycosylase [Candidatus Limnocylindrales bacterium]|nr:uracil-DNA glycosylase [Candidatus Limnocylindrales bacterium]
MSDDRTVALEEIAGQVRVCTLCDLHKTRTRAVPGAGSPHAEILFIGEGPGYNEDKQGLPFVGRSGNLLTELLQSIGLTRAEVFITNVVKCRPPENRDPLPVEIGTCRQYLDAQEALIDPLVIVTLGRFSMARYFPNAKITAIHGKPKYEGGRAYVPLFHPAAVLRNPALEQPMAEDFQRILEALTDVKRRRAGGAPAETPPAAPARPSAPPLEPPAARKKPVEAPAPALPPEPPPAAPDDDDKPVQLNLF